MSPISQSLIQPETLRRTTPSSVLPMKRQLAMSRCLIPVAASSAPSSGSGFALAVEHEPGEANILRLRHAQNRVAVAIAEDRASRHAFDLRAGFEGEAAGRIDAGGEEERRSGLGRLVGGKLQRRRLVEVAACGHDAVGAEGLADCLPIGRRLPRAVRPRRQRRNPGCRSRVPGVQRPSLKRPSR